jgi:hypothetical protein
LGNGRLAFITDQGMLGTIAIPSEETEPSVCSARDFAAPPNPIISTAQFGFSTLLTGTVNCSYEIHNGSPSGLLIASGKAGTFSVSSGIVANGTTFFLQRYGNTSVAVTLASISIQVGDGSAPAYTASGFALSSNPLLANGVFATGTLIGSVGCRYEIHTDTPWGLLVATGPASAISVRTGSILANGTKIYLQRAGDGSPKGTLAAITANVRESAVASCVIEGFAVNPSPVFSDGPVGTATLTGNVGCAYDVRVGGPGGTLFTSGSEGQFSAATGKWVSDNLTFYLQARGNQTASGTLATAIPKSDRWAIHPARFTMSASLQTRFEPTQVLGLRRSRVWWTAPMTFALVARAVHCSPVASKEISRMQLGIG